MQNLKNPNKDILINELTVKDFGMYEDELTSNNMLLFKKHGLELPDDGSGSYATVVKGCANPGVLDSVTVVLNAECPCDECNYEYGITLIKRVKHPGVMNFDYVPERRIYYGKLDSIDCTAGYITDAHLLIMENDLLSQMKDSEMSYSFSEARRFYKVIDDDSSDASTITITDENGVATPITTGGGGTNDLVNKINDDSTVSAYVFAFATADDELFLTSVKPGYLFTAEAGIDVTIVERGLWIQSKRDEYGNAEVHFDIEVESSFGIVKGLNLLKVDASTATTSTLTIASYDYATKDVTLTTTSGANIGAFLTSASAISGIYAHRVGAAGTDVYIVGDSTLDYFTARVPVGSTLKIDESWSKKRMYPSLTGSDVFKMFANIKDQGSLGHLTYLNQPNPADEYCHYNIEINYPDKPAIHGASHRDYMKQIVNIYIKKSYLETDFWDNTNELWESTADDAGFAADLTFDELIEQWCGTNPA